MSARRGASPEAIEYQYDAGNEFFALWLDEPTMSYSCALWDDDPTLDLAAAQRRKIDYHVRTARAEGASRVLDVGCGWGGLLRALVERHGVSEAVGLTLSRAQQEWVTDFGLPGVEVRLESWEDHEPEQPYDAVISVGAFEHFARPRLSPLEQLEAYRAFFARCHTWLKPSGWLSLQTMAFEETSEWMRYAFAHYGRQFIPESDAPFIEDVVLAASPWFNLRTVRCDGEMYARTFAEWLRRLRANREQIVEGYGHELYKRFRQTLSIAEILFQRGHLTLYRCGFERRPIPRESAMAAELGCTMPEVDQRAGVDRASAAHALLGVPRSTTE